MDPFINPKILYRPIFGQYSPPNTQAGRGFLSIFSKVLPFIKSVFKSILPVAKKAAANPHIQKAANQLKDHAIDAGINVASDALQGKNIGESLKRETINIGKNTAQDLLDTAKASRKRPLSEESSLNPKKKKKKKKKSRKSGRARDLFD